MEEKERARDLLLLLVTAGMEIGRCGGRKLLCLVTTGVEVDRCGAGQLLVLVAAGMPPIATFLICRSGKIDKVF